VYSNIWFKLVEKMDVPSIYDKDTVCLNGWCLCHRDTSTAGACDTVYLVPVTPYMADGRDTIYGWCP